MDTRGIVRSAAIAAVMLAAAVMWSVGVSGCSKKPGAESVFEIRDALAVTSDTLSKTDDSLAVTSDTLYKTRDTLSKTDDTFTDERDGKKYKTATIDGKTWMAENLNYRMKGSWCYDDDKSLCVKYGRLYDWNAAMKACFAGWRLPSREDWNDLVQAVGGLNAAGKKLKAKSGWNWNDDDNIGGNGTDDYGFSALPGGYRLFNHVRDTVEVNFGKAGVNGYWWTATDVDGIGYMYRYSRYIYHNHDYVEEYPGYQENGYSVRCVADDADDFYELDDD